MKKFMEFDNRLILVLVAAVGIYAVFLFMSDFNIMTEKISNMASASWSGIVRNAFSKTYLTSLMELVKIATDDNEATAKKWFRNKIGSYIPNVYTKLVNDPYFRDIQSILDNVKHRTGIEVQVKYNFRGEPLKYDGDFNERIWRTMFNPLGTTKIKEDVVAEEILRLGQNISPFKKFLKGTEVDLTQFINPKTGQKTYTPLIAISLMVFYVYAAQCMATFAVVKSETNGWKWPIFMMVYMTLLAYGMSFMVFQVGRMLGFV